MSPVAGQIDPRSLRGVTFYCPGFPPIITPGLWRPSLVSPGAAATARLELFSTKLGEHLLETDERLVHDVWKRHSPRQV